MICPICGEKTKVIDSRSECDCVKRRRECLGCGYRFSTEEIEVDLRRKTENEDGERMP